MTAESAFSRRRTPWQQTKYIARRALGMAVAGWVSLYRFTFRRPAVAEGAEPFGYHRPISAVMIVFIVLAAVEIPVADLIVQQWLFVRIPFLILGIWALTFIVGFLLGYLMHPHTVGVEGVQLREGAEVDIRIGWEDFHSLEQRAEVADSEKEPRISEGEDGPVLHLRVQNETNLALRLERPMTFQLPWGAETVQELRFHADEPKQLMDAVRRHLA